MGRDDAGSRRGAGVFAGETGLIPSESVFAFSVAGNRLDDARSL